MLRVEGLHFRHHWRSEREDGAEDVLKGVGFFAPEGRMTVVVGPNGSGKTTLFKCIAGLWTPRKGIVIFADRDLTRISPRARAKLLALVPQEHDPPFPYRVFEMVLMGRTPHLSLFSTPSQRDREAAYTALEIMGIAALADRPYTKISGGERQLVLLARALAQEAPLLLLDEPTSHLDFRNQIAILEKVRQTMERKGWTVLMTLHDPNLALQFADHVVMMGQGLVPAQGSPAEVLTAERIKDLYGLDVSVIHHNGVPIIHPEVRR